MSESATAPIPAHVAADRIFDFDVYDIHAEDLDYSRMFKRLNAPDVPEVFWTPRNGGHWVVTRADEIDEVLDKAENFSSIYIAMPKGANATPRLQPLQSDPPEHLKYRQLLVRAFSPKAIKELGEEARAQARGLIEALQPRGECEFVADFAHHMPIAVFMSMLGLPDEDRPLLVRCSNAARRGNEEERKQGRAELARYGLQKANERRKNPTEDLLSTIATAEIDGELMDDETLSGMLLLLLLAGLDTVASMMCFFVHFLIQHPEYRRKLAADPSLIPVAVEELLRRFPIVVIGRVAARDVVLKGATIREGDMIAVPTPLHGLDDDRFPNPLSVDFARQKPFHATFGGGAHRCMGAMLARAELRIFLEEWLRRIPDFAVKPGAKVEMKSYMTAVVTSLPLVWEPQA